MTIVRSSPGLVVGTAGHIDHGKSALVKALTGIDPDRLKEEQARGITIDLGFAHAEIGGVTIAFVDVPGHERFVRNMLAGAGGVDAVLLVVAADESVMPQTREHFEICRLLGIERGLVALTKADLADPALREMAAADVRALVAGSFLEGAPIVPVSARSGDGLDELRSALSGLAAGVRRMARRGALRLPIDRAFTVKGFGTVVTGTLVSGRLAVDDHLVVQPEARSVRVRGLQVHGRTVGEAVAPNRVAVNLSGVSIADVARGATLTADGAIVTSRRADARVEILESAPALKHGARVKVFQGTSEVGARVALSAVRRGRGDGWQPARPGEESSVPPGGEAFLRLRLDRPVVITRGDRFVLRALTPATTIGGGTILDPAPPAAGLRRPEALGRFTSLDDVDAAAPAAADAAFPRVWIGEAGQQGLSSEELAARGGLSPNEAAARIQTAVAEGGARLIAGRAYATSVIQSAEARVRSALAAFHAANPDAAGMPAEAVRERVATRAPAPFFDAVLGDLLAAGIVTGRDKLRLSSHAPAESPERARLAEAVESRFREGGLTPPDLATVAADLRASTAEVDRAIRGLIQAGRVSRLGELVFHADALTTLAAAIQAMRTVSPASPATVDVATFKQRFGLTRKHAIPLLEWLDRQRLTRRVGQSRTVL